ncbi:SulP family inorganic anion transporter [Acrocarpospora macrocephala]|uniref:Sodium-independent anion transporter n=1 Tax=Acrocarpospora macrocephala TaxID=150177 RepID=A0A5M3WUB0_9ACTN|nr:sulfate permease [Acrocarpospora macrocephala]GES12975.1 sodium-independent anion transporter [Acrocarpospora macrocephala]
MIQLPPVFADLRGYRRTWLRGDLLAGLTVAGYLVPQVMAYATVAGLPPVAGLWAILAPLALYAVLGSSRQLSIGPESSTALMTAVSIGPLAAGDPARYAALAATLAVLVGVFATACWALRLGFVADLLSRPVLVGYLAGLAFTMIVGQLGRVTGVPVSGNEFFAELASFARGLPGIHGWTLLFAVAVLAFLFLVRRLFPALPGPLLVVLLATAAVAAFGLERYGIKVVGPIPGGLPAPGLSISGVGELVLPALGVLLVGYSDNMLTGRSFAARHNQQIDANQELLALGAANVGAGLFQGFPVSSSGSRTALADAAGSRTQLYSLVTLLVVVLVLLAGGPLLAGFPLAALGAIVVYAALQLIDVAQFRRLFAFRRSELLLAVATCVSVLVLDILYGVLLAVALSVAEMLARVARPHDAILGIVPGLAGMHDIDDYPQARTIPGLLIYRYDSPLFFANAQNFRRRALAAVDSQEDHPIRWFVLNAEANVEVDITALEALDSLRSELTGRGIVFGMARVKQDLRDSLDAFGLTAKIGEDRLFPTLPTAVAAYEAWR